MNPLFDWSSTTSVPYCNWTGISCAINETHFTVSSLNLQSLNLSGEISPSLTNLGNLTYLSLAGNFFNEPIHSISLGATLISLDLSKAKTTSTERSHKASAHCTSLGFLTWGATCC
ncbi:hypothetical protein OROMI_026613 [Orobanche minor]